MAPPATIADGIAIYKIDEIEECRDTVSVFVFGAKLSPHPRGAVQDSLSR